MTQYGPITTETSVGSEGAGDSRGSRVVVLGPQYVICRQCVKRIKLGQEGPLPEELRCDCGARLHPYDAPAELSAPARGVLPRLTRFWVAGREDGYWDERRFFRPAAAERVGATPRQVRFAYEAGRRVGERLRQGAHLHALRVMKMKAAASATSERGRHHTAA